MSYRLDHELLSVENLWYCLNHVLLSTDEATIDRALEQTGIGEQIATQVRARLRHSADFVPSQLSSRSRSLKLGLRSVGRMTGVGSVRRAEH